MFLCILVAAGAARGQEEAPADDAAPSDDAAPADDAAPSDEAAPAAAEETAPTEPATVEEKELTEDEKLEIAREFMETGQMLYATGKFEKAAEAFIDAYEYQPFAAFLFNAGVAFEKGGKWAKAKKYLEEFLEVEPDAPDRADIEARIAALEERIPEAPPEGCGEEGQPACPDAPDVPVTEPTGEPAPAMKSIIKVRTKPAGAKVIVTDMDDAPLYTAIAPVHQTLEPGKYKLRVEHPEFQNATTPITVSEGRVYVVVVELSQGTFLGYLSVKSSVAGANVYLDDKEAGAVGQTPWANPVPTGDHLIWIERPGYQPVEKEVSIGVGDSMELDVTLARVEFGEVHVVTNVDHAILSVDETPESGKLPLILQLPAGEHMVKVDAKGLKTYETPIDVQKGQRTKVLVRLNPKPNRTPAWVSFGFATALLTAGIVFAVQSKNLEDEIMRDYNKGWLDNNDPRFHYQLAWNVAADFSFLMAGISTLLGFIYLFRDPLPDSEGKVKEPVEFADLPEYSK